MFITLKDKTFKPADVVKRLNKCFIAFSGVKENDMLFGAVFSYYCSKEMYNNNLTIADIWPDIVEKGFEPVYTGRDNYRSVYMVFGTAKCSSSEQVVLTTEEAELIGMA